MIEHFSVYITSQRVMVRREHGWPWRKQTDVVAEEAWQLNNVSSLTLHCVVPTRRWSTLSIYLGAALCKFMPVTIPASIQKEEERRIIALAQMQEQLGINPLDWEVTVDLAPAQNKSSACAVRRDVMEQIRLLATQKKMRLISAQPLVGIIWNTLNEDLKDKNNVASMTIEEDAFTVVLTDNKSLNSINSINHFGDFSIIDREINRLRFSLGDVKENPLYLTVSHHLPEKKYDDQAYKLTAKSKSAGRISGNFNDVMFSFSTSSGVV